MVPRAFEKSICLVFVVVVVVVVVFVSPRKEEEAKRNIIFQCLHSLFFFFFFFFFCFLSGVSFLCAPFHLCRVFFPKKKYQEKKGKGKNQDRFWTDKRVFEKGDDDDDFDAC